MRPIGIAFFLPGAISQWTALSVLSISVLRQVSTDSPLAFDWMSWICTKAALEINKMRFVKLFGEQKSVFLTLPFHEGDAACARLIKARFVSARSRMPPADALEQRRRLVGQTAR
jgi:hypothetical protein